MEIDPILNVVKTTFPQFNLEEIIRCQFIEKIAKIDSLSFNIHFKKGEENTAALCISSHKNKAETAFRPTSIMLIPDRENNHKLKIQQVPFSVKTNVIIDNPYFWESAQEIRIRQLKIIPAILDKAISIETMRIHSLRHFKINIKTNNQLIVNIWDFDEEKDIDISNPSIPQIICARNCNWSFKKYFPNEMIQCDAMSEIVISFDKNVVEESILIKRERQIHADEYYLLVLRK